jgi:hypothetical protein
MRFREEPSGQKLDDLCGFPQGNREIDDSDWPILLQTVTPPARERPLPFALILSGASDVKW